MIHGILLSKGRTERPQISRKWSDNRFVTAASVSIRETVKVGRATPKALSAPLETRGERLVLQHNGAFRLAGIIVHLSATISPR